MTNPMIIRNRTTRPRISAATFINIDGLARDLAEDWGDRLWDIAVDLTPITGDGEPTDDDMDNVDAMMNALADLLLTRIRYHL